MNAVNGHDGYAWQYGGVVPPEYGSFAECHSGDYEICPAVFYFGQFDNSQSGQTMDVFVWDDNGGVPGAVLCYLPDVEPGPISNHPTYSTHVFPLEGCTLAPRVTAKIAGSSECAVDTAVSDQFRKRNSRGRVRSQLVEGESADFDPFDPTRQTFRVLPEEIAGALTMRNEHVARYFHGSIGAWARLTPTPKP